MAAEKPEWDRDLLTAPHAVADKRQRVRRMFAGIAPSYDLNNRLHSLGMDQRWRGRAVKLAQLRAADVVVDVACGTGDLAMRFAGAGARRVLGVDFTLEMLALARQKAPGLSWAAGDAQAMPLSDACADVVSIAFGIRNVADPRAALAEFYRILRPGGRVVILEFSLPRNAALRGLYNFYFRRVLPRSATLISGDTTGAYKYLPESVQTFIGRKEMVEMMGSAGFADITQRAMSAGICVCYRGTK